MSLKTKENVLMQAEELLAVKDRRIKELERLLMKAQMLLHSAGVTDVLTSNVEEAGYDGAVKTPVLVKKPDSHQECANVSKSQPDQMIPQGSFGTEQPQDNVRTTEYSPKSSQGTLNTSSAVVKMTQAVPLNLEVSISSQPKVVTHTPPSKVSVSDTLCSEMSNIVPVTSAVVSASDRSSLTTSISPKSGKLIHLDSITESTSSSTRPSKIIVVPVTTRDAKSCSSDSLVPSFRQEDSPWVTPTENNCASLKSVAGGTLPSTGSPVSTPKGTIITVPLSATTSGSYTSTSDTGSVTVLSPGTTSGSCVSTSDSRFDTVPLPGTTSGSYTSTSDTGSVTVLSPGTTSGSCVSTSDSRFDTVPLPGTTSGSYTSTSDTGSVTVLSPGTTSGSYVSTSDSRFDTVPLPGTTSGSLISTSSYNITVQLPATTSLFSSTDTKMTTVVNGSPPDTKSLESARTVGDASLKGELGGVAIYFADGLENFDIAQEETVSMESDATKQDGHNGNVIDDEETFVPPTDLQSTIGKGCRTHEKSIPDLFDFASHEQNHQPPKRFQQNLCGECGKTFASKRILRQHVKIIHESEQTYLCNVCQKVFRHVHNLNIHKQNQNHFSEGEEHLVKDGKILKCGVCHKTFRRKYNMQDHLRLHSGERPFWCSYCDRRFAQISNYRKHELTHTGKRPYSCDQCHKTFTSSSNLKRHQVAHDLHKNYLCPVCGKAFTQKWNLKKHERRHKACHKSESSESILLSKNEVDEVISSPALEVKVVHFL